MSGLWKNTTAWAAGGATLGAIAVLALSDQQVSIADHWAEIVAGVAACVSALALAFRAALKKRLG